MVIKKCHPEQSEGSECIQILHFVQNDTTGRIISYTLLFNYPHTYEHAFP